MMLHMPHLPFPFWARSSRYGYHSHFSPYMPVSPSTHIPSSRPSTPSASFGKTKQTLNMYKPQTESSTFSSNDCETIEKAGEDSPLFQLFGISLYNDDLLLICLIFFLYQEGVKDQTLFMALILLLFS